MDPPPRPSTDSDADSFVSGRSSPLNGFDSSAALILVTDIEDSSAHSASFAFSPDDGDEDLLEDQADLALERLRADNVKSRTLLGGLGTMEGKGGGGSADLASVLESKEIAVGCSGPMNGADSTVGLHNSYSLP